MMQRLAPLKLSPVFNVSTGNNQVVPLLDMFIISCAGSSAHKNLYKYQIDGNTFVHWHLSLLTYIDQLIQLMYPFLFIYFKLIF